jgi:hypothetical protein
MKLTIDTTKIDRKRIKERTYKNRDGYEVTVRDLELELIPLREERRREAGDYQIVTTHFITQSPTKEERQGNVKMPGIGEGWHFEDVGGNPNGSTNG